MAKLRFKDIGKIYPPDVQAVRDFNLEIEDKEFVVFVGPSGCGKSTVLRMVAGLENITSGEIYIGDRLVNRIEPKDRNISMVFQNYALYPHMNAYKNISFGLEVQKMKKAEIEQKVKAAAKMLDIEHLLDRKPGQLSGGEKQRVAIGRAIVRSPEVFLFDEPLSNLDAKLRTNMRKELIRLHKEIDATFIYVTHDQIEAMTMADKIVIMNKGVIQQVGTPDEIYNNPANIFVADFIGTPSINLVEGTIAKEDKYYLLMQGNKILLDAAIAADVLREYEGKDVKIGIRPGDILVADGAEQPASRLKNVQINQVENTGTEQFVYGLMGSEEIVFRCDNSRKIRNGEIVDLRINIEKVVLFDLETGSNLNIKKVSND
ncbi:sn-glycerol-3-phosphate ABC transporter ATP-binding protein UgpC [Tyzzerella sp. OttesenSCG-928-J15]|nr:sn-glycerol-3-phosphate ABC transporter ATP-binding protein UgpC [Tyzzerella sp. OttesenSCG-928-J15]